MMISKKKAQAALDAKVSITPEFICNQSRTIIAQAKVIEEMRAVVKNLKARQISYSEADQQRVLVMDIAIDALKPILLSAFDSICQRAGIKV